MLTSKRQLRDVCASIELWTAVYYLQAGVQFEKIGWSAQNVRYLSQSTSAERLCVAHECFELLFFTKIDEKSVKQCTLFSGICGLSRNVQLTNHQFLMAKKL
ncbi:putative E3 ubiquitin-protein ligase [Trichinella pseudospiralis]